MNMPNQNNALLDDYIEAAREVDDAALNKAVTDFREGLPVVKPARQKVPAWLRYSGAVAMLVLAVSIVPTFMPKNTGAQAFAQVQAWFEDYQTLQVNINMMMGDMQISEVKVWGQANGATRVEVPPTVTIIDPVNNVMHMLLPEGQVMTRELGIQVANTQGNEHLEWLEELREFQGVATIVDESRVVDGIDAIGWQLNLDGQSHTLWTDPDDNRPLLMEAELPGGLFMTITFSFNSVFPAELFEAPVANLP